MFQLCAAWRCIPLLLAYAMWRIHNPWVVAVSPEIISIILHLEPERVLSSPMSVSLLIRPSISPFNSFATH